MSVKSKHSVRKESTIIKEKNKKVDDSDEDFESSEEELDLTKECHPIGYYMNDRAEMINQMFSVIKGNKLKAMLPPVLKECDIEQLKLRCLDQLLGMSEKRITCILEGEILESSSESDIESDQCNSDDKYESTSGTSSNRSEDSLEAGLDNDVEVKQRKRKKEICGEEKPGKLSKTECGPVEQGKTLLEILELEMRARAIRALLKQSGNERCGEQVAEDPRVEVNGVKEMSGEIVDLTECEDEEMLGSTRKELQEEKNIEQKVSVFEEKIKKSQTEKPNPPEGDKSKRLQAELELRNKLFKKKIYRTRQQRMESEEEEKSSEVGDKAVEEKKEEPSGWSGPSDVVVEGPEEGELSASEEECTVGVKQEAHEGAEGEAPATEDSLETKVVEGSERIRVVDDGTFVRSGGEGNGAENWSENGAENGREEEERSEVVEQDVGENVSGGERGKEGDESVVEETSWRDRWLQKDGVQKLVKSSKIYAKVKKRIAEKSQKAREDAPGSYEANSDSNSNSKIEMIEGSIEEYERLLGRGIASKDESATGSGNVNQSASEF